MSPVSEKWDRLLDRVAEAAARSGRTPAEVDVCAVTKTVGPAEVRAVVSAGARILGENRLQIAEPKIRAIGDLPDGVEWHMIGHLQRNKARKAAELFAMIHSVDSLALARRLSDIGEEGGTPLRVLVEVHTSSEASKGGLPMDGAGEAIAEIGELEGLDLRGLMTMAPFTGEEARIRASFSALRELRESGGGAERLPVLSMGMTNDFEIAVEEGSTLIRVGTGIFG